jgi:hypothetical protein
MKTTKPAAKKAPAKKTTTTTATPEMTVVTELPQDATVLGAKPAEQPAVELTLQDIVHFKNILEVVSTRGAFKPEEMILVGETYAKLTAFIAANK